VNSIGAPSNIIVTPERRMLFINLALPRIESCDLIDEGLCNCVSMFVTLCRSEEMRPLKVSDSVEKELCAEIFSADAETVTGTPEVNDLLESP